MLMIKDIEPLERDINFIIYIIIDYMSYHVPNVMQSPFDSNEIHCRAMASCHGNCNMIGYRFKSWPSRGTLQIIRTCKLYYVLFLLNKYI